MVNETAKNNLQIASLNIGRGIFNKEELLINTIDEHDFDICALSEVDIKDFDETKPFSIDGLKHTFPYRGLEQILNNSCVLQNPTSK